MTINGCTVQTVLTVTYTERPPLYEDLLKNLAMKALYTRVSKKYIKRKKIGLKLELNPEPLI